MHGNGTKTNGMPPSRGDPQAAGEADEPVPRRETDVDSGSNESPHHGDYPRERVCAGSPTVLWPARNLLERVRNSRGIN